MPAPFTGELFTFYEPDGSEITVRGWGNQFEAVFETLDGYTVVRNPDSGLYHYARLSDEGNELIATDTRVGTGDPQSLGLPQHARLRRSAARAHADAARTEMGRQPRWMSRRDEKRAQRNAQRDGEGASPAPPPAGTTGDYVGLLLLVEFPDVPAMISRQEIDDYCNKIGYNGFGNNGSAYDYFLNVSDGRLRYKNVVAAYHTARHPRAYYTDRTVRFGKRAQELIKESLDSLAAGGFDFSELSNDSDGFVYALSLFYAGSRINNWSEGLWPHSWTLATPYVASATKTFSDYQITDIGTQLTLRTFCHENGHMICDFPDLYDYDAVNVGNGIGHYSLMCFGGSDKNPTQVEAYLKHAAGWTSNLTTLTSGMSATVTAGKNDFLIYRRNATEYFILENRRQADRDASIPDAGLAIWHIDETGDNSFEQMTPGQHYECSLEQADNRFDLERRVNGGDAEDLYGGLASKFGRGTAPNSNWWDGSASGLEIEQISAPSASITVRTKSTSPERD